MISNYKRAVALTLLASAASVSFAAPAPVSDLNSSSASTSKSSSSSAKETETERLERLLRNSNRVQANLQQQVDEMSLDVSELRGELERNNHEMRQLIDRQRELFIELDKVRSELAKVKQAPAQPAESAPAGKYSSNQDEQQAYQSAVDLILKNKDYDAATVALEQFKKDFPQSVYSPNANYWLGQLYFSKKKDVDSAKAFAAVVAYKDSNKRADALVKLGDIAARNNSTSAAKKYYQQAVDEHPNTSSANSAKKKLSDLK
ncbi:tol-pal system protein YbgF [Vibrio comitans]|uniref:Cell division coordinator CpoB n=1 Tax=Vibrio comitans NBRC 102076 TaxID=1219078 RepID=A0A4Y3IT45_9VIBR|nr:tol-pal system protein YbgF [Vibrio comitans]GEA61900.1 tol-pal system protein YbgF [Vibrio comitans NBRC 102076]